MTTANELFFEEYTGLRTWVKALGDGAVPQAVEDAVWVRLYQLEDAIADAPAEGFADIAVKLKLLGLLFEDDRSEMDVVKTLVLSAAKGVQVLPLPRPENIA